MILYLHGFASGPGSTKARYFERRFAEQGDRVTTPDLAEGDFEHLTIASQLAVVEREAAGRPVVLIGSSMGGYLAALYAARHPEVLGLVLLAPAFAFPSRWPLALGEARVKAWRETGKMRVFHYGERREMDLSYQLLEDGQRYEDFPEVKQPVLIYHGRRDDVVPAAASEHFAKGRENVKVHVVDSGHELTDVLEEMWQGTRKFVASVRK